VILWVQCPGLEPQLLSQGLFVLFVCGLVRGFSGGLYPCLCSLGDHLHGLGPAVVVVCYCLQTVTICNFVALVMKFGFTVVEKKLGFFFGQVVVS
jgi:hypothetical protein